MKINTPLYSNWGVEVTGIDARDITSQDIGYLRDELLYRYRFLLFRGQDLDTREYIDFARRFGTPQVYVQDNYHHPDHAEIFVSSNISVNGKKLGVARTGYYWHTDCAFQQNPLPLTMLYPQIIPRSQRETLFIDMAHVWKNLPSALRQQIEGRYAQHAGNGRYKIREEDVGKPLHEIMELERQIAPPVTHPAIIEHTITGEDILYINEGFTIAIDGYTSEESNALLKELFSSIDRAENVITHSWEQGDILVWDNRFFVHKAHAAPSNEAQVIFRIGIYDGYDFYPKH